jgi:lambda family phage tail tape measure protein
MDIASLGIKVDSTDAAQASTDLDKLTAAGARAEKASERVTKGADKTTEAFKKQRDELAELLGEIDPTVKAMGRLDDMEARLAKHKSLGLEPATFSEYQAKIDQSRANLGRFDDSLTRTGNTAKQTANALRGVPAQFTDIAVSLQGGQAPLTVFLQQGGQLKDMFGGVGPAAKALGGYVLGLVNPFTVAAAAAAVLTLAYYQGSEEQDAYRDSLATTGNAAGTTTSALSGMAKQVSATVGTTGAAAAVLAQLAGSGKIVSGSFEEIAIAALAWEKATGRAASETVAEFAKLADDPVKAVVALNDKYNFLTAAVLTQIRALQEQGDTLGAQQVAEGAYADALVERAGTITNNLGAVETAWAAVKSGAKGAWDAILDIGREDTFDQKFDKLAERLATLRNAQSNPFILGDNPDMGLLGGGESGAQKDVTALLQKEVDDQAKARQQLFDALNIREGSKAYESIQKNLDGTASKATKLTKALQDNQREIAQARKAGFQITAEQEAALEKQTRDKFKETKTGGSKAVDLTAFNDAQNQLKAVSSYYQNTQKELDAAEKAGLISAESYSSQRVAMVEQERVEIAAAYESEISALEAARAKSSTSGQQRIQIDQKIADARASMVKAEQDANTLLEVLASAEAGRIAKQTQAISSYTDALNQQNTALQHAGQRAAAGVGQGDRQASLTGSLNGIEDRANQQRLDLARDKADKARNMSAEEYQAKLDAINRSEKDLAETTLSNYEQMSAAQSDWRNGATSAFGNYLESARDVAGQTKSLFTNALTGMEDAIVNFAMTGKLSFSDFAKSILADMARIAARQASSALLSSAVGAATSYFGGAAAGGAGAAASAGSTQAGYSAAYFPQALGGAWSGGVQMFANGAAFTNSVVSKPTAFAMANGKTGVMGEAGEEAIMPLTRTAGGQLGVRALSSGSGGNTYNFPVAVSVQTSGEEGGAATQEASSQLGKGIQQAAKVEAETAISRAIQPGGSIWRLTNGRG